MIDAVIAELAHRREGILEESKRMQREMIAYAELSQSTVASTREISATLADLAKQEAPTAAERKTASEEFAARDASRFLKARTDVPLVPEE